MPVKYDIEPRESINISMSTCNIFSHPPRVCAWPFQRVVPSAREVLPYCCCIARTDSVRVTRTDSVCVALVRY